MTHITESWVAVLSDGTERRIKAERWEDVDGDAIFYDEEGDQVVTLARGEWREVKPR